MTFPVLRLQPPLRGLGSDCWCPSAAGSCCSPFDLQPASLTGRAASLSAVEEAAMLLSGSILEHLRDGRPGIAAHHADRLATLTELA